MTNTGMTYGVDYNGLDFYKRAALEAAKGTRYNLSRRFQHLQPVGWTRGESVHFVKAGDHYDAHVHEGLGTKNLIADAVAKLSGVMGYYARIAQDTVAMIVNDMITLGALPVTIAQHLSVDNADWLQDEVRTRSLIEGWQHACNIAGCVWSGGETPSLSGIIMPGTAELSGSATGKTIGLTCFNPSTIEPGDAIVMVEGTGMHANGATFMRELAPRLSNGYLTKLPNGKTFGESILVPTPIYVGLIEACIRAGLEIRYGINITGHGWRKIMRAPQAFTYVIENLPEAQPLFQFVQEKGGVSDEEMYRTFNMGAGFVLIVSRRDLDRFKGMVAARRFPLRIFEAGRVEEGPRQVVINPVRVNGGPLTLAGKTLDIR